MPLIQISMLREQAKQDQATLNTISEVLNHAIKCFQKEIDIAEHPACAVEIIDEAQHAFSYASVYQHKQQSPTYHPTIT